MHIEDKYADTVTIVYPAMFPASEYNLPINRNIRAHVTVTVLGDKTNLHVSKQSLASELSNLNWEPVEEARVTGLALFGPEKDFLVMLLNSDALLQNRQTVDQLLASVGVRAANKYLHYLPHLTLMETYQAGLPSTANLPKTVSIGAPALWWGKETFPLQ